MNKACKAEVVALCWMISFVPIVLSDYIRGWYPLQFRYYMFPLIAYSFGLIYATAMETKIKASKVISFAILTFLIFISFLSPAWHIYYLRQLYDPSVGWKEVGYPNPEYVRLGKFLEVHPLGHGIILSDSKYPLAVTLPLERLSDVREIRVHYGESNTYIIEFLDFHIPLGYGSPESVRMLAELKERAVLDYCKVLDSGPYTIYCKP
jgi:hypothetical protein